MEKSDVKVLSKDSKLFLYCDCVGHALELEGLEGEDCIFINEWTMVSRTNFWWSIKQRIKKAFSMLVYGKCDGEEILLNKDSCDKLRQFLSELEWKDY